jgi:serine/threonine-protein kinase
MAGVVGLMMVAALVRAEAPPRFAFGSVFQQDISAAPVHPQSASMIATNMAICAGDAANSCGIGCGFGCGRMQIDFSIEVMQAAAGVPTRPMAQHAIYADYYLPDCEPLGTLMPLPPWRIEVARTISATRNNDCHLIAVRGSTLSRPAPRMSAPMPQRLRSMPCVAQIAAHARIRPSCAAPCTAPCAGFPTALLFNAGDHWPGPTECRPRMATPSASSCPAITHRRIGSARQRGPYSSRCAAPMT